MGNLSMDMDGRLWQCLAPPSAGSQLVVPQSERRSMIRRFHDSLFAGHLEISPSDSCVLAWTTTRRSSLCGILHCVPRKEIPMPPGHVTVGRRWERVAMDLLDMSITSAKGNRFVLVMVDCFSRWTEACPLLDKTAISVADAFFSNIVWRFGMPSVIHSDQGREFENKVMHELCLLGGSHKTKPYYPKSDGLVERFNRTLLMLLAMFAGEHKDDWDDLLPPVMMAYRSSVHESTGFSPYRLMLGEECTLPMDIGLPRHQPDPQKEVTSPYAVWVAFDQVRRHSGQAEV